jgi:DNA-binding transcriptional ArsR family regulator
MPARLRQATDVFKAAGHPARLRILGMLRSGSLCVCQVTATLGLAASTVSAHLADLKRAGLVVEDRNGRWVSHRLAEDPATTALLERVFALIDDDPQVAGDAQLVRRLRRIGVESLCRVDLDLARLGLGRPAPRGAGGRV